MWHDLSIVQPQDPQESLLIVIHHQCVVAEVVVPCTDIDRSLIFFCDALGFRVDLIFPADRPTTAVISAHGATLRLVQHDGTDPISTPLQLNLVGDASIEARQVVGPDGVTITWLPEQPTMPVPPGTREFVISRGAGDDAWGTGRAGMQYRDLIPGRLGGRFVASHIRIPQGGPVPDYVHFHRVRFQMIYCVAGWVKVVYEDQGPPFVMHAGDCVLQPRQIRHRVLEASAGLEVVEISCPAIHDTVADHDLALPSAALQTSRDFNGQRFVRHVAAAAPWSPWQWGTDAMDGWDACDVGIDAATGGLARVSVVRCHALPQTEKAVPIAHQGELLFLFVLDGAIVLHRGDGESGETHTLQATDSVTLPAKELFEMTASLATRMLVVSL